MVRLNRDLLCESLGLETSRLIIPHQIHGARVRRIDEAFFMQTDAVKAATLEGDDGRAESLRVGVYRRLHTYINI